MQQLYPGSDRAREVLGGENMEQVIGETAVASAAIDLTHTLGTGSAGNAALQGLQEELSCPSTFVNMYDGTIIDTCQLNQNQDHSFCSRNNHLNDYSGKSHVSSDMPPPPAPMTAASAAATQPPQQKRGKIQTGPSKVVKMHKSANSHNKPAGLVVPSFIKKVG